MPDTGALHGMRSAALLRAEHILSCFTSQAGRNDEVVRLLPGQDYPPCVLCLQSGEEMTANAAEDMPR